MYKKIDVYVNGKYEFSTTQYPSIKALKARIRADKHILIHSIPNRYLTIYDYDKLILRYA